MKNIHNLLSNSQLWYYFRKIYCLIFLYNKRQLRKTYKEWFGEKLQPNTFETFNSIIWTIKLSQKLFSYKKIANKVCSRKYIAKKVDSKYLIPIIKIIYTKKKIDFMDLPYPCVIKTSFYCGDKEFITKKIDTETNSKLVNKFSSLWCNNYFFHTGEKQYLNMKKHILVEKFLPNLIDIKIIAIFNSKNILIRIPVYSLNVDLICDRNLSILGYGDFITDTLLKDEKNITNEEIKVFNEILSKIQNKMDLVWELFNKLYIENTFIRIDFLLSNDNLYVGEFTVLDSNGHYFGLDDIYKKRIDSFVDKSSWKFTKSKYL